MDIQLRAYSGVSGALVRRLPFTRISWSDSINEIGSMSVEITQDVDAESLCAPWKTILAVCIDGRIAHAGYVKHLRLNANRGTWSIDVGGGFSIFEKRLVLNPKLATAWTNGKINVDEEHPVGNWQYSFRGSYSDLVSWLIYDSVNTWGGLPMSTVAYQGGNHERNYNSFDYATVWDRIRDIADLEDGPEIRLDPILRGTALVFQQRTANEIVDHHWKWNVTVPGSRVIFEDTDIEGDDLCTQSYGAGGREKDMLLVARATSSVLTSMGYPVLQEANNLHSSVSELPTLQSYVNADVNAGRRMGVTRSLQCDIDMDVRPGDWADVRTNDGVINLKITDVSGDTSTGRSTLQATDRY